MFERKSYKKKQTNVPLDRLCAHQLCRCGFFCSRNCGCPVAPIAFVPEFKRFGILVSRLDGSDLMGAVVPKRFGRTDLSAQGVGCVLHSPEGEGGPLNEVEWWVRCYSEFPQNSVVPKNNDTRSPSVFLLCKNPPPSRREAWRWFERLRGK